MLAQSDVRALDAELIAADRRLSFRIRVKGAADPILKRSGGSAVEAANRQQSAADRQRQTASHARALQAGGRPVEPGIAHTLLKPRTARDLPGSRRRGYDQKSSQA